MNRDRNEDDVDDRDMFQRLHVCKKTVIEYGLPFMGKASMQQCLKMNVKEKLFRKLKKLQNTIYH